MCLDPCCWNQTRAQEEGVSSKGDLKTLTGLIGGTDGKQNAYFQIEF